MRWICDGDQRQGNRRRQEDRWDILREETRLLALAADGMGGMPLGAEAAEEAVKAAGATFQAKDLRTEDPAKVLLAAVTAADEAVFEMAAREGLTGSVGTTLVAVLAEGRYAWWISVGDSRVYLYRKGVLKQLSRDHTVAEEIREARRREISSDDATLFLSPPEAITSFIGIGGLKKVSRSERPLHAENGDCLLLATDGLFNTLNSERILACLRNPPEERARALVRETLAAGNPFQDNVTAVTLTFGSS